MKIGVTTSEWASGNARNGDFNGDGKTDIVTHKNGQMISYFSNFAPDRTGGYLKFVTSSPGSDINFPNVWAGDFNNDGKTDLVTAKQCCFVTHFSRGDGTYERISVSLPAPGSWVYTFVGGDVNGDGRADLTSYGEDWDENGFPIAWYSVTFLSKGDGNYEYIATPVQGGVNYQFGSVRGGDYAGSGKAGITTKVSGGDLFTYLPAGPYPDLLNSAVSAIGASTAITYKPLTDDTVYTKDDDAVYPVIDLQPPNYVVSHVTVDDGRGTMYPRSYSYGGAKMHLLGRGGLGFRWKVEADVTADSKVSTFYNQVFPLTGLPSDTEYDRNSDGAPFKHLVHQHWSLNAYPSTAPTVSFVSPKQIDTLEWDGSETLNRTLRREFSYDSAAYGNLTSTYNHGDVGVSGDEREETTDWVVDAANWLHRPKTLRLKDGSANVVREKWLYYDNQAHGVLGFAGLATKEENNAGGGIGNGSNPVFLYTYDPATGVRTDIRDPRLCDTTTTYESTKTFPQSVAVCSNIPALNFVTSYVYDARFGVPTSETRPYRVGDSPVPTTTYNYDSFGRLTKMTGPLDTGSTHGTETRQYLQWGDPTNQRIAILRTEEHGTANALESEQYFDGLGRTHKVRREGPDTKKILLERSFDSRDLVTSQSAPYFANSQGTPLETPKYELFAYDPLGRPTQITHADSTSATSVYARGVVTLTDERGKVKKKHFDGLEQLTKVQELSGAQTHDTIYQRDAAGSLKTLTNALGHITRIDYDMLGRKRAMCDPNMGTPSNVSSCTTSTTGAWVYTYNPASDLLTQKDAKNQTLTFTYDEAGRPLTKKEGTTTITSWTYDDPLVMHSKGRVTRIVDRPATQNTITTFAYDVLGQVTQSQRTLLGVPYTMSQTYDALGRIKTETFPAPDNETVTYSYNEAGWLKIVPNYINDVQYNARGQRISLTYANSRVTTWTYDANRFWETGRATSGNQQSLTYGRDNVGNVTSITDGFFTAGRTFAYDDLNRMITASGTFGANQAQQNCSYAYNAIGNLTGRCGATLSYGDAMHPSAVTTNPGTGKSYTYDANGNMLTRGNQTLAWDIENRVTSVAASGGGATLMEYDYTGMRVKKNAPAGITLFPFKGIEIDPSGTFTKFIRIGAETIAARKRTSGGAISHSFYHNDHLGGVHVITNGSGNRCQLNEYDPWGGVSRSEGATPGSQPACDATHRFTGQELDPETGLYYYGGRYYDQEVGRFASPDPFVQSPDDPQNLNRYSYVLNNPQGYVDPSGFVADPVTGTLALISWGRFFYDLADLFGLGDTKKIRPKAKQRSAPQPQNEVTNKNGPEPSKNVSVYQNPIVFVGQPLGKFDSVIFRARAGSDYPEESGNRPSDWNWAWITVPNLAPWDLLNTILSRLETPATKLVGPSRGSVIADSIIAVGKLTVGSTTAALGIAIGAATIADNFATAGLGILNDPVTLPVATGLTLTGIETFKTGLSDLNSIMTIQQGILIRENRTHPVIKQSR